MSLSKNHFITFDKIKFLNDSFIKTYQAGSIFKRFYHFNILYILKISFNIIYVHISIEDLNYKLIFLF